jgi:8-oxo-dGTP diphosphatase
MRMNKTFGHRIPHVEYYDREGAYLIAIQNGKVATLKTPKGHFLIGGGIKIKYYLSHFTV